MKNKLLALLLVFLSAGAAFSARISDITIDEHKLYDNLSVFTSDYLTPDITVSDNPPGLTVEFKDVKVDPKKTFKIQSKRVKGVKIVQSGKNARVIFELFQPVDYESAVLFGKNETLIEIRGSSRPVLFAKTETVKKKEIVAEPKIVKIEPEIKPDKKPKEKAEKKKKEKKPAAAGVLKGMVFVVDPGHGGSDPGAFGLNNLVERNLTLKTAIDLVDFLKKSGAKVYLTRKRSVRVGLREVVDFSNKIKPDAYIGIHFNAAFKSNASGVETYYYNSDSRKLAETIHKNIVKKINRPDRGVRKAMLYTIHHAKVPAVIVEPAYVTNPQESQMLLSGKFLKEIARGVAAGIKEYAKSCRK